MEGTFPYEDSEEDICQWAREMDRYYGTIPSSPLHHDNNCKLHMKRPVVEQSLDRYDS